MAKSNGNAMGVTGRICYVARVLCVGSVTLLIGNSIIIACAGSEFRWRPRQTIEIVNTGTGIAFLYEASGGSSVAMDCLPGMLPVVSFSQRQVFVDFPLWIPVVVSLFAWAVAKFLLRFQAKH